MGHDYDLERLLRRLSEELEVDLALVESSSSRAVATTSIDPAVLRAVTDELLEDSEGLRPFAIRLQGHPDVATLRLPSPRPAILLAIAQGIAIPDLGLLQHAAAVVATQRAASVAEAERRCRVGEALLSQVLDRRLDALSAQSQLAEFGLAETPLLMMALTGAPPSVDLGDLHHLIDAAGPPHLILTRGDITSILLPSESIEALPSLLSEADSYGISAPITSMTDLFEAQDQARWALHVARAGDQRAARYGEVPRRHRPSRASAGVDQLESPGFRRRRPRVA